MMDDRQDALDALVSRFATLLEHEGLHAALGFLNARTRHRFTGVYRFDPPMLRNLAMYDRENPKLKLGGDTPMRETYCSLVGARAAPFTTGDARRDVRLIEHPARQSVLTYCGVPLLADDGLCFGSLCHFDVRPRVASVEDIPLLERAASQVMRVVARAGALV
jgi:GAF domain-containing protein